MAGVGGWRCEGEGRRGERLPGFASSYSAVESAAAGGVPGSSDSAADSSRYLALAVASYAASGPAACASAASASSGAAAARGSCSNSTSAPSRHQVTAAAS